MRSTRCGTALDGGGPHGRADLRADGRVSRHVLYIA
jgi:hypothetical protein